MGESLRQMADVKYSLDDNIKQNFLEPLHHLQTKDLKEVMVRIVGFIWVKSIDTEQLFCRTTFIVIAVIPLDRNAIENCDCTILLLSLLYNCMTDKSFI